MLGFNRKNEDEDRTPGTRVDISLKTMIGLLLFVVIVVLFLVNYYGRKPKTTVLTSAELEKAIYISDLSTAEFVYNGIAEKENDNNTGVSYYVAYKSTVKVGVKLEDISFQIDEKHKKVTPVFPQITINNVSIDSSDVSYMPDDANPDIKETMELCKADVEKEANESKELFLTADQNLRGIVEALLGPILKDADYTLEWSSFDDAEKEDK